MTTSADEIPTRGPNAAMRAGSRANRHLPAALVVLGASVILTACTPVVLPGSPPGSPPLSVPLSAPATVEVPTTVSPSVMTTAPATTEATTTTATTPAPATSSVDNTTVTTTSPATSAIPPATVSPIPATPAPTGDAAVVQQILDLVNVERAAGGCPAVVLDAQLSVAAQGHAEDMAANNYFAHDSLDGRSPFDRIKAAGYAGGGYQAENIARGQVDATAVMQGWMNSPGHRANILNCVYDDLGVGYTRLGRGPYWVQNFGGDS